MSAHYDLMPLSERDALPKQRLWLEKIGLVLPDDWQNSRDPTAAEVRSAIGQLADRGKVAIEADFHVAGGDLDAIIRAKQDSTFLSLEDYAEDCDEDTPRHLSFQYGDPELVILICERLARLCGHFLLTNNGAYFMTVSIGTTSANANWVADDF